MINIREKKIPVWIVICLVIVSIISSAAITWALTSLKVIRGVALVEYKGDIKVEDFKFVSENEIAVTISTTLSSTPSCTIRISGAGISGSKTISAGWSSPYTVIIPFSGTLTEGTITIEITT